ncbi:MAG: ornithine carbamoyltransferase, partial [Nitrososphaerota archaeon]|nr:ornithine carbamoyltransferase [Nitrososphaerota archaeon]
MTDVKKEQVVKLWNLATNLKKRPIGGALRDRNILLLFEKPSTRTRVSFEVGVNQLSGHPIYMDSSSSQLSRGESIEDTAHTLDRYIDIVVARVYKHEDLIKLALAMEKPVVNALSDIEHPCQGLSDLFTINEKLGRIDGVNIAYVGDPNNVFNSLVLGAAIMGARVILASPKGYMPRKAIVDRAEEIQRGSLKMAESPAAAVTG